MYSNQLLANNYNNKSNAMTRTILCIIMYHCENKTVKSVVGVVQLVTQKYYYK